MTDDLKFEYGLWWPGRIGGSIQRYLDHQADSDKAVRLLPKETRRRTAIQAGSHVGLWSLRLARKFQRVVTFEPEPIGYRCAKLNTANSPTISVFNAALADREGETTLVLNPKNTGGSKCRAPNRPKDVAITVRTMTIDSLGLEDVDLVYLDVEGMEWSALHGALETIKRCQPVIGLEEWSHGAKMRPEWQWTAEQMWKWLRGLGYEERVIVGHDHIWAPK